MPEPWRVVKDYHGWAVRDADDWLIAVTTRKIEADRIAAVPEMVDALKALEECVTVPCAKGEYQHPCPPCVRQMHAAIAKAKGE